jgi:hypothetical protein
VAENQKNEFQLPLVWVGADELRPLATNNFTAQFYTGPLGATTVPPDSGWEFVLGLTGVGSAPIGFSVPVHMPAAIPRDEAFYWSMSWQADVRESMSALEEGDVEVFDSDDPTDVVRWLLSDDH